MSNFILILTEGEKEEVWAINNLYHHFFQKEKGLMHIISFKTNIYSLFTQLKEDDFDTDIVELLKEKNVGKDILCGEISIDDVDRDDVSEVYLLFDYDAHHYGMENTRALEELQTLITHFNNETENGKLYISYPMIEALNHHLSYSKRDLRIYHFPANSGKNSQGTHFKKIRNPYIGNRLTAEGFTKIEWETIFKHFLQNLYYISNENNYSYLDTNYIFNKQLECINSKQRIFILSGLPPFVFEYFGKSYFEQMVKTIDLPIDIKVSDFSTI